MCGASASGELNVRSENQGSLHASQAVESYLRFPTTAQPMLIGSQCGLHMSPCSG